MSDTMTPSAVKADILDWGTDKDVYHVGDKATIRASVRNSGDEDITLLEARVSIEKEFLGKFIRLIGDHIIVPMDRIKPGDVGKYERTETIPNFPGRYRVTVTLLANGQETGEFQKIFEVTR